MRSSTESITVTFSRKEGLEIKNQIIDLINKSKKSLHMDEDLKNSSLKNLYTLLNSNFDASISNVHFLNKG